MSNTYSGIVDTTPFAFTNQPGQFFPDDRQGTMIELDSLPPGESVDDIFYFNSPTTGKFLSRIIEGTVRAAHCGIYVSNAAAVNDAKLASALANFYILSIAFDEPRGGTFNFSDSFAGQGKKLIFRNKNVIAGGTFDEIVIDCSLSDQCLDVSVELTNCRSVLTEFSCENFGAVGDRSDETEILQKTSDTLIQNVRMPKTIRMFPGKEYGAQGWVWYRYNGTNYDQFTLSLVGQTSAYSGNESFLPILFALNPNAFGINIQRATAFTIKGIVFKSYIEISSASDYEEYVTRSYATFSSSAGARDSTYSPFSLLLVDGFRTDGLLPPDNGYPDWNGTVTTLNPSGKQWYLGNQEHVGSTGGVMEDLSFSGSTVSIMVSPNGITQQAENMTWHNIYAANTKAVFGFGQAESKNCFVYSGYCIDRVHTVFDGVTWGSGGNKTMAHVKGWNTAGSVLQIINGFSQHAITFENIYTENLWRIGEFNGNAGRAKFQGCNFSFVTGSATTMPVSHFSGSNILFDTCTIRYYDDLFNKRVIFIGDCFDFLNCNFDLPPLGVTPSDYQGPPRMVTINVKNCYYSGQKLLGWETEKGNLVSDQSYSVPHGPMTRERMFDTDVRGKVIEEYNAGSSQIQNTYFQNVTFIINATTRTATFTNPSLPIIVGHYIIADIADGLGFSVIGRVDSIDYVTNDVSLVDVPIQRPGGTFTTAPVGIFDYRRIKTRYTGIYTYNSDIVTDVFGTPTVGNTDPYSGSIILSFNSTTKVMTMQRVCFAGPAGVPMELYSPATEFGREKFTYIRYSDPTSPEYSSTDPTLYFPGDIWIAQPGLGFLFTEPLRSERKFRCILSGYVFPASGQKQAIFEEFFYGEYKQSVILTSDSTVVIPRQRLIRGWVLKSDSTGMTITAGSTNFGTQYHGPVTLTAGVSQVITVALFADSDTVIYFNDTSISWGTLSINFF